MQSTNIEGINFTVRQSIQSENLKEDFEVVFDGKNEDSSAGKCSGCGGKFFFAVNVATA